MNRIRKQDVFKKLFGVTGVVAFGVIVIIHPHIASDGVKNGLLLLGENLIPALFPFMIVSGYVAETPLTDLLARKFNNTACRLFRTSAYSLVVFTLGCLGGYPIGARIIKEFRQKDYISDSEAARLFNWCINPSASFVITAVGTFMLGNTLSGVIIYISCITSSILLGVFSGFFCKGEPCSVKASSTVRSSEHIFIKSVSSSIDAMLGICGWVLFFSTMCELSNQLIENEGVRLLVNSVAEVTLGCKSTISAKLPLPVICAVVSFGGFAVASQISPYLAECGIKVKSYLCWRLAGGAVSAFLCSQLIRFFPRCTVVSARIYPVHALTNGIPTALIMLLMCVVLIFEVDNKRKVC